MTVLNLMTRKSICLNLINIIIGSLKRMSQLMLRIRRIQRSAADWFKKVNPRLDYFIDKYHVVKVGCAIGILINSYLIYDGMMNVIVLRKVKQEVQAKRILFYKRVEVKREEVLALMRELEKQNLLPAQQGRTALV